MNKLVWLVSGSRHLTADDPRVNKFYKTLYEAWAEQPPDMLIHGAAKGVDTLAGQWVVQGSPTPYVVPMEAQWKLHGNRAGPLRNHAMINVVYELQQCQWDIRVMAFPASDSVGTREFIEYAERMGIFVHTVELDS